MICDILIRSYWRDFAWLSYSLRSIARYCSGFRQVILVVPESSHDWLRQHPPLPSSIELVICKDYPDDYLGQQVTKLQADHYSDADFICHVDSDCIFNRPTRPQDLIPSGRPVCYTRPVSELPRHWPWTRPTTEILGWQPTLDFMQYPPFTYPGWLYPEVRNWCQQQHEVSLEQWVMSRPPRGFSEFNLLGAYAHRYYRDHMCWRSRAALSSELQHCLWFSSWDGLNAESRRQIKAALGEAVLGEPGARSHG